MFQRSLQRILRGDRAQAITEFALTLPILLIFTGLLLQTAMLVNATMMTDYAAFQAARTGMLFEMNSVKRQSTSSSDHQDFLDDQEEMMRRAAILCLLPLRYTIKDTESYGMALLKAHLTDEVAGETNSIISQIDAQSDLLANGLEAIESAVSQLPSMLADMALDSLFGSFLSGVVPDMGSGLDQLADGFGDAMSGVVDTISNLGNSLRNELSGAGIPTVPVVEVSRLREIDSAAGEGFTTADLNDPTGVGRQLTVEIIHYFKLTIPVVDTMIYATYAMNPGFVTEGGHVWDGWYIPIRKRYSISVPHVTYTPGSVAYFTGTDWNTNEAGTGDGIKHYKNLSVD
jgi:hypothetical protein